MKLSLKKVQSPLGCHKRAQTAHKGSGCQQQHCLNSGHSHQNLCKGPQSKSARRCKTTRKETKPIYTHAHTVQTAPVQASFGPPRALVNLTCNSFRVRFTHISAGATQKRKGNQNWESDIVHRSEKKKARQRVDRQKIQMNRVRKLGVFHSIMVWLNRATNMRTSPGLSLVALRADFLQGALHHAVLPPQRPGLVPRSSYCLASLVKTPAYALHASTALATTAGL